MTDWSNRESHSSFYSDPCVWCGKPFERWSVSNVHPGCEPALRYDRSKWLLLNSQNPGQFKGHYITAVDGKEYYHEEWANKKIYKQYEEYERLENAPAMKLAQDNYKQLEQMKQQPKELE